VVVGGIVMLPGTVVVTHAVFVFTMVFVAVRLAQTRTCDFVTVTHVPGFR
jgi:hypothetical protein